MLAHHRRRLERPPERALAQLLAHRLDPRLEMIHERHPHELLAPGNLLLQLLHLPQRGAERLLDEQRRALRDSIAARC